MSENELSKIVFNCALKVHQALGPGLLESTYKDYLFNELKKLGLEIEKQVTLPLAPSKSHITTDYQPDIIIENKLILEIKAIDVLNEAHFEPMLTYLKLTNCKLGLLINFNVTLIKKGIKKIVNNF